MVLRLFHPPNGSASSIAQTYALQQTVQKKHQQHLTETHNLPIQVWIKNSILISNAKGVKHFVQATLHQGPKTLTLFYFDV
jgi:hypothetical protein